METMHDSVLLEETDETAAITTTTQVPPIGSDQPEVGRLEDMAFVTVRRTMGIGRLNKADELPLPPTIVSDITRISHRDFVYDTSADDPEQFTDGLYPAVCTIDSSPVYIRISSNTGSTTYLTHDPSYISSLTKDDNVYHVFARTQRLRQKIRDLRCRHFPTQLAWRLIVKMATQCEQSLPPTVTFGARNVHFYQDVIFIRPAYSSRNSLTPIMAQQQTPESTRDGVQEENGGATQVLCVGRVVEEMLSWFGLLDRNEPLTSRTSLGRLKILVNDCLNAESGRRPSLHEVKRIAQQNI